MGRKFTGQPTRRSQSPPRALRPLVSQARGTLTSYATTAPVGMARSSRITACFVFVHGMRVATPNENKVSDRRSAARHLRGGRKGGGGSRWRDARSLLAALHG